MTPVRLLPIHSDAPAHSWLREVLYRPSESLRLVVASEGEGSVERRFVCRFEAPFVRAFLWLDEGDLMTIWQSPHYRPNAALLYEVVEGSLYVGFSELPGVLSVSTSIFSGSLREYLLATNDDCVLVLSTRPPAVEETHTA